MMGGRKTALLRLAEQLMKQTWYLVDAQAVRSRRPTTLRGTDSGGGEDTAQRPQCYQSKRIDRILISG